MFKQQIMSIYEEDEIVLMYAYIFLCQMLNYIPWCIALLSMKSVMCQAVRIKK